MLAYTTRGEGPRAVIMLHGFLGSARNLSVLAHRWVRRDPKIRVVLPDLTGHGNSPPLPPGADLAGLARDILGLATELGIPDPLYFVGHSLGGRVSMRARMLEPERVRKLVILDSTPARLDDRRTDLSAVVAAVLAAPDHASTREEFGRALLERGLSNGLVDWLLMNVVPAGDGYRWRIDRRALADLLERTRTEELWPAVEQPGAEIKVIRGELSSFVAEEDIARIQRAGREVINIPRAGHYLHVERPEAVLNAIVQGEGAT